MMLPSFDSAWMQLARAIMDVYVKRTHGTYIEQKGSALLWQYRDADPEFGHMQSKELEVGGFGGCGVCCYYYWRVWVGLGVTDRSTQRRARGVVTTARPLKPKHTTVSSPLPLT